MAIIAKPGLATVLELIRNENPWLPNGVSSDILTVQGGSVLPNGRFQTRLVGKYGNGYRGSVQVQYSRLDLSKLLGPKTLNIGVLAPVTLYNAFDDIARAVGIQFGPGDVLDVSIPSNATLPYVIEIQAHPLSALYTGKATIQFVQRDHKLGEVILTGDVDAVLGGVNNEQYGRAELLTYGLDYTESWDALSSFTSGSLLSALKAGQLANALNSADNLGWNNSAGYLNLTGAVVRYNGSVSDYSAGSDIRHPNPYYERVLVLDFTVDLAGWDFYSSSIFIHYNTIS